MVPDLVEFVADLAEMLAPSGCLDFPVGLGSALVDLDWDHPVDVVAFEVAFWIAFAADPFVASFVDAKQNPKIKYFTNYNRLQSNESTCCSIFYFIYTCCGCI